MRKLKLQMQMTLDGFVARPDGKLDWMTWQWDDKLTGFVTDLTQSFDTILLGRNMTPGFVAHWEKVAEKPENLEYASARIFVDTPKIVFSKTVKEMPGKNVRVENGDLVRAVTELKQQPGRDIMVYGGAGFVASLLDNGLIDELNLFVNPAAIGEGMRIFNSLQRFQLSAATGYDCGVVVLRYVPKQ